jgi:ATP-dependent Clp protease ATP-binding subunit ClpX
MGFDAPVRSRKNQDVGELLSKAEPDDLVKFGIIPELVGRMPVITCLQSLTKDDLVRILVEPKNALAKQYKKLLSLDNVDLEIRKDALDAIAQKAVERKIGARGLRSIMESIMTKIMFLIPSDLSIRKVVITPDSVNGADPEILRDTTRPREKLGAKR